MKEILLAYWLPKEIVAALMMLYKKHENKSSLTGLRHRLLVADVLQGDTLAP